MLFFVDGALVLPRRPHYAIFAAIALAFMPMMGIGIGVSVLVGQALGRDDPALARPVPSLDQTLARRTGG